MPVVKWVADYELQDRKEDTDEPHGGKHGVPVLTLDQIEEWIITTYHDAGYEGGIAVNDLIAQVQAWKGNEKVDKGNEW